MTTSCLGPCHTFTGIVDQWRSSRHFATYVANLGGEEVETWTGPTACGGCHAIDGPALRVEGKVGTKDGTVAHLDQGQTNYIDTAGKLGEAAYAGKATVAAVYCTTCHKIDATNDPHKTGQPYAAGTFGYWVPTGADDEVRIEKSPAAGTAEGTAAGKYTTGNVCIWCHKSRKDVTNYIKASNTLASPYWGPHEGPQADVYTAKGGYHFGTNTYGSTTAHTSFADGCITCHMPGVADNGGYANHSFYAQQSACANCHSGATSFDVNGMQTKITQALTELETALNDAGYLSRGTPGEAILAADLGKEFAHDVVRVQTPPLQITADQAGALYNYLIIARGGALGVHNPLYVQQLLFDSILTIKGSASTVITTRP